MIFIRVCAVKVGNTAGFCCVYLIDDADFANQTQQVQFLTIERYNET